MCNRTKCTNIAYIVESLTKEKTMDIVNSKKKKNTRLPRKKKPTKHIKHEMIDMTCIRLPSLEATADVLSSSHQPSNQAGWLWAIQVKIGMCITIWNFNFKFQFPVEPWVILRSAASRAASAQSSRFPIASCPNRLSIMIQVKDDTTRHHIIYIVNLHSLWHCPSLFAFGYNSQRP